MIIESGQTIALVTLPPTITTTMTELQASEITMLFSGMTASAATVNVRMARVGMILGCWA